ncbi:MAG: hypothetical protein K0R49_476 [Burkholderiales bacterium]|jgi:uncharacterized membrane protein YdjX (TVP38/TMEM64 family)|nr:hypothetical protein [Burkholderiales bacterium]MCE3268224.1 hypothetical protein [Burkholderiales bacterium]
MKRSIFKISVLVLIIALFAIVAKHYHLNHYLSLQGFNNYRHEIMRLKVAYPIKFSLVFVVSYIILIILCIPGTILFDLIAGFVFGYYLGTTLAVLSYGIGAFLNFLLVRYFFKNMLANKFTKFKSLVHGSGRYGLLMNLIGLRLIIVIPFWILNIVAALLNINARTFLISTLIGILPSTLIYVIIGNGVRDMLNTNHALTSDLLTDPKVWLPIFAMAILILLPNIIKYYRRSSTKNNISG